ncbi:MAG TPA: hypothetical protein VGA02_07295 [Gemmatimonadales bacterium]
MTSGRTACHAAMLVATVAVAPAAAVAQSGWGVGGGAATRITTVRRATLAGSEVLSGVVVGGEGRLAAGRFTLRLAYAEGSLHPDGGDTRQQYVEGSVALGLVPLPGLEIAAGPYARAYIVDAIPQRRLLSRLHARYEAAVVGDAIRGHVEAWAGLLHEPSGRAAGSWRGGGVGVSVQPVGRRIAVRVSYMIDRAHPDAGPGPETVEALAITVTVGRT